MMMTAFEWWFQIDYDDSFFEMLVTDGYDENRLPTSQISQQPLEFVTNIPPNSSTLINNIDVTHYVATYKR